MSYSSRLLNFIEPYNYKGFTKTKFYTEVNTDLAKGDRVFILNGNYDNDAIFTANNYDSHATGYVILEIDRCGIVLDVDYDATKLPYNEASIDDLIKVYVSNSNQDLKYFRNEHPDTVLPYVRFYDYYPVSSLITSHDNYLFNNGPTKTPSSPQTYDPTITTQYYYKGTYAGSSFTLQGYTSTAFNNGSVTGTSKRLIAMGDTNVFKKGRIYKNTGSAWVEDITYIQPILTKANFRGGKYKHGTWSDGVYGCVGSSLSWDASGGANWDSGILYRSGWTEGLMDSKSDKLFLQAKQGTNNIQSHYAHIEINRGIKKVKQVSDINNNNGNGYNYIIDSTITAGEIVNANVNNSTVGAMNAITSYGSLINTVNTNELYITNPNLVPPSGFFDYNTTVKVNNGSYINSSIVNAMVLDGTYKNTTLNNVFSKGGKILDAKTINSVITHSNYDNTGNIQILGYEQTYLTTPSALTLTPPITGSISVIRHRFYINEEDLLKLNINDFIFFNGLKTNSTEQFNIFDRRFFIGAGSSTNNSFGYLNDIEDSTYLNNRVVVTLKTNMDNGGKGASIDINFVVDPAYDILIDPNKYRIRVTNFINAKIQTGKLENSYLYACNYNGGSVINDMNFRIQQSGGSSSTDLNMTFVNSTVISVNAKLIEVNLLVSNYNDTWNNNLLKVGDIIYLENIYYNDGTTTYDVSGTYVIRVTNYTSSTRKIQLDKLTALTFSNYNGTFNTGNVSYNYASVQNIYLDSNTIKNCLFKRISLNIGNLITGPKYYQRDSVLQNPPIRLVDIVVTGTQSNVINSGMFYNSFFNEATINDAMASNSYSYNANFNGYFTEGAFKGGSFSGFFENNKFPIFLGSDPTPLDWTEPKLPFTRSTNIKYGWDGATFSGGDFNNSTWVSGDFLDGTFRNSNWLSGHWINGKFGDQNSNIENTHFISGTWDNGIFINGLFGATARYSNYHSNHEMPQAIWNNGTFRKGRFTSAYYLLNSVNGFSTIGYDSTVSPHGNAYIFAATDNGVYRALRKIALLGETNTDDATWFPLTTGLPTETVYKCVSTRKDIINSSGSTTDPTNYTYRVFVGSNQGLFYSKDNAVNPGSNFKDISKGLNNFDIETILIINLNTSTTNLSLINVVVGTHYGIYYTNIQAIEDYLASTDEDATPLWAEINDSSNSFQRGTGSTLITYDISSHVVSGNRKLYAATDNGIFTATLDASASNWTNTVWTQSYSNSSLDIYSICADQLSGSSDVFAGTNGLGVLKSSDAGVTWTSYTTGLVGNALIVNNIFKSGTTIYIGTSNGVYKLNGNPQWDQLGSGIPTNTVINSIGTNGGDIYAGGFGAVFTGVNNSGSAITFHELNNGLIDTNTYFNRDLLTSNSIWNGGVFENGTFDGNALWNNGTWLNGNFLSSMYVPKLIGMRNPDRGAYVYPDSINNTKIIIDLYSWKNGVFYDGVFGNATTSTKNSRWKNGVFKGGLFQGKIWRDGVFVGGKMVGDGPASKVISPSYKETNDYALHFSMSNNFKYYGLWVTGSVAIITDVDNVQVEYESTRSFKGIKKSYDAQLINILWQNGTFDNDNAILQSSMWWSGNFKRGTFKNSNFNPYVERGGTEMNEIYYRSPNYATNSTIYLPDTIRNDEFNWTMLDHKYDELFQYELLPGRCVWTNGVFDGGKMNLTTFNSGLFKTGTASGVEFMKGSTINYGWFYNCKSNGMRFRNGNWYGADYNISDLVNSSGQFNVHGTASSCINTSIDNYELHAKLDILNYCSSDQMIGSSYFFLWNVTHRAPSVAYGTTQSIYLDGTNNTFVGLSYSKYNSGTNSYADLQDVGLKGHGSLKINGVNVSFARIGYLGTYSIPSFTGMSASTVVDGVTTYAKMGSSEFNTGIWENGVWNNGPRIDYSACYLEDVLFASRISDRKWSIVIEGDKNSDFIHKIKQGDDVAIGNIVAYDLNNKRKLLKNKFKVINDPKVPLNVGTGDKYYVQVELTINSPINRIQKDSENHKIVITNSLFLNGMMLNGLFQNGVWNAGFFYGYPKITEIKNMNIIDFKMVGGHIYGTTVGGYPYYDSYGTYSGLTGGTFSTTLIQHMDFDDACIGFTTDGRSTIHNSNIELNFDPNSILRIPKLNPYK